MFGEIQDHPLLHVCQLLQRARTLEAFLPTAHPQLLIHSALQLFPLFPGQQSDCSVLPRFPGRSLQTLASPLPPPFPLAPGPVSARGSQARPELSNSVPELLDKAGAPAGIDNLPLFTRWIQSKIPFSDTPAPLVCLSHL